MLGRRHSKGTLEEREPVRVEMMRKKNEVLGDFAVIVDGKHFDDNF